MFNKEIVIFGGGGHAKVVLDCLIDSGTQVKAIIDYKFEGNLFGVARLKTLPDETSGLSTVIAIGDNLVRKKIVSSINCDFITVIHRSAIISSHCSIGKGCMILHSATIQANAIVRDHVIINTGAQLDHDSIVNDFVHLAPGSKVCGSVCIGEGAMIGAGAIIIPNKKIGVWATVGAGAVVIDDIPDYAVAVGNPARVIKYNRT
jgi:sugar O-acyltransferase (sialic acid O-acetyltransferase NeuD family)